MAGGDPLDVGTPEPRDPAAQTPAPAPARRRGKRGGLLAKENRRLVLGALIGALVTALAIVNRDEVEVDWVFGTAQTPLIILIALTFVLGALTGWIAGAARRRRR